jgi:hydroxymethylpyrimidine/phosphomethylpyrimidine kinase
MFAASREGASRSSSDLISPAMSPSATPSGCAATRRRIPCVLSIAGSDSGGGAGIQADLKAFAACGVHGMTALTAVTAQNTVGVTAVEAISPELILAQVRAVSDDIGVDAVKIGMLGTAATIEAVAQALRGLTQGTPVVLDPVMVSESGAELLEPSARGALMDLLPQVTVLTPNLPEARALVAAARERGEASAGTDAAAGGAAAEETAAEDAAAGGARGEEAAGAARGEEAAGDDAAGDDAAALARALHALGPAVVVVTGGHRDEATDVFFDGTQLVALPGERYPGGAAHGSGCTHSSVLAARLAWGDSPLQAARTAKRRASEAVRDGLTDVGAGAGPVDVLGVT